MTTVERGSSPQMSLIEPHGAPARQNDDWPIAFFRLHSTRAQGDGELAFTQKSIKARFFAPLVSSWSPRWKFSAGGKQQNSDAYRNYLISTYTGKLKISVRINFFSLMELLLFSGELFSLFCTSFLGEGSGEDRGGCWRERQLWNLGEGALLLPSAYYCSVFCSPADKCVIIDKKRKNLFM